MTETFGQKIKAARLKLGFTQVQVAEAVNCDQGYLSELERGLQTQPGHWLIRGLADFLHLSAVELWESLPVADRPGDSPDVPNDPELAARLAAIDGYWSWPESARRFVREQQAEWLARDRAEARRLTEEATIHLLPPPPPSLPLPADGAEPGTTQEKPA